LGRCSHQPAYPHELGFVSIADAIAFGLIDEVV
jgi:hypothetical protein